MADMAVQLAPVSGRARIEVIDMLRGIAILGIFFMNIPFMAATLPVLFVNVKGLGWSPVDAAAWWTVQILLEGTQRGLLEMLFGAGLMVIAARAMEPDGPVAVADLYIRRNLWLLAFGLIDIFVLLWAGDILHIYALAALFLFPFRKLGPKLLLGLGMGFALWTAASGGYEYVQRADLMHRAEAAQARQAAHATLTADDKKAIDEWKAKVERKRTGGEEMKQAAEAEKKGHGGGLIAYAMMNIGFYVFFVFGGLVQNVAEAFCMMLVGIALWKWGVIQGQRSARFYLGLMLACYLPGFALRAVGAQEHLLMLPTPKTFWFAQEFARIATSIGHVALVNLLVKSVAGRRVLLPFRAAGRTAFSLYFMQQIIGIWILFAPWGPGLWGKLGWAGMMGTALAVIAAQLVIANLWLKRFVAGPLEWAWRSLAYARRQPFLRDSGSPTAPSPDADPTIAGAAPV